LFGFGVSNHHFTWLRSNVKDFKYLYSVDFKSFDQTVPRPLLEQFLLHIYEQMVEVSTFSFTHYLSERDEVINSRFSFPDGDTYEKSSGITSGDPWTSLLGSLISYYILRLYLERTFNHNAKAFTFGDDGLLASHVPIDLENLADFVQSNFKMIIHPDKSISGNSLLCVPFLSTYLRDDGSPFSDPLRSYLNLLYPERWRDDPSWEIMRARMALILNYYGPLRDYIEEFLIWIEGKYEAEARKIVNYRLGKYASEVILSGIPTPLDVNEIYFPTGYSFPDYAGVDMGEFYDTRQTHYPDYFSFEEWRKSCMS
jgi:hypothetical protein